MSDRDTSPRPGTETEATGDERYRTAQESTESSGSVVESDTSRSEPSVADLLAAQGPSPSAHGAAAWELELGDMVKRVPGGEGNGGAAAGARKANATLSNGNGKAREEKPRRTRTACAALGLWGCSKRPWL